MEGFFMAEIESCRECGVPRRFIDTYVWFAGGILVQRADLKHRFALVDILNLDPLYKSIEEIIGVPIERIVIKTKRRATRGYMSQLIPPDIKELVLEKEIQIEPMIEALNATNNVMGYGDASLVAYRLEMDDDDFVTERIEEPYSVPLWCGDLMGAAEAVTGHDLKVEYEWVSRNAIEVTSLVSRHPPEFEERLNIKEYDFKEGIELESCSTCGGPSGLSTFEWRAEKGIIKNRDTGRRMALVGPAYQDAIFDELERELGEAIPKAIIEAERRFVRSGFFSFEEIRDEEDFRRHLALRGFGDLQKIALGSDGMKVSIKNAAMHLIMAGLMQGYFETVTGRVSRVGWEMKEDGTLDLDITPGD
jgi:hypothetical protein